MSARNKLVLRFKYLLLFLTTALALFSSPEAVAHKTAALMEQKTVVELSVNARSHGRGMAIARYYPLQASLSITDSPLTYRLPFNSKTDFTISYNSAFTQRDSISALSNLGRGWSFNWLSFVKVDETNNVTLLGRSGNTESFRLLRRETSGQKLYKMSQISRSTLKSSAPNNFQRNLPDGSVELFDIPDGTGRILLSTVIDPQGNKSTINYDKSFRIVSITDPLGQKSTLTYLSATEDTVGFYRIASITDPFGRSAKFAYDQTQTHLISSTDTIGLVSKFRYAIGSDFINNLTTPYGSTTFQAYKPKGSALGSSGLITILPNGDKKVVEHWAGSVRESYVWDREATKRFPSDPSQRVHTHCSTTHWHTDASTGREIALPTWSKEPLENAVHYKYAGPQEKGFAGKIDLPIEISRSVKTINGQTANQVYQYEYNDLGNIVSERDPVGRQTSYLYASNGIDLVEKRIQDQTVAKWEYNNNHLATKITDSTGVRTFQYNSFGQISKITQSDRISYEAEIDKRGNVLSITGPIKELGALAKFTYDKCGRILQYTNVERITQKYTYDNADRKTAISYSDGSNERIVYNKLDAVMFIDRLGKQYKRSFDSLGQLSMIEDPMGQKTFYKWCGCGALHALTDASNHTTNWHHDIQGRLIEKTYPNGSVVKYKYEPDGHRLESITDAMHQTQKYSYNLDDTVSSISYLNAVNPTSTVRFQYHRSTPQVSSVSNGWGTVSYDFGKSASNTPLFRVTNNVIPDSQIELEYDQLGRISSRAIGNENRIELNFDSMGRIVKESNPLGNFIFKFQPSPGNSQTQLTSIDYPMGLQSKFAFNSSPSALNLKAIKHTMGTGVVSEFDYLWEGEQISNWNQLVSKQTLMNQRIAYDKLGQLKEIVESTGTHPRIYQFTLDPSSNIRVYKSPKATLNFKHTEVNTILTQNTTDGAKNKTASFKYDANGNLLSNGEKSYKWDAENRLIEVNYPGIGNSTKFIYNGLGECSKIVEIRQGKTTSAEQLIWCGAKIAEVRDAHGKTVKKFFSLGEIIKGEKYYFCKDHLGSIRQVMDQKGTIQSTLSFDPLGQASVNGRLTPDLQYAGYFKHKPSGLYLTPFRMYDSTIGRWISRDPFGEFGQMQRPMWPIKHSRFEVMALNLYAYAANNAINFIDPLGLCPAWTVSDNEEWGESIEKLEALVFRDKQEGSYVDRIHNLQLKLYGNTRDGSWEYQIKQLQKDLVGSSATNLNFQPAGFVQPTLLNQPPATATGSSGTLLKGGVKGAGMYGDAYKTGQPAADYGPPTMVGNVSGGNNGNNTAMYELHSTFMGQSIDNLGISGSEIGGSYSAVLRGGTGNVTQVTGYTRMSANGQAEAVINSYVASDGSRHMIAPMAIPLTKKQ